MADDDADGLWDPCEAALIGVDRAIRILGRRIRAADTLELKLAGHRLRRRLESARGEIRGCLEGYAAIPPAPAPAGEEG